MKRQGSIQLSKCNYCNRTFASNRLSEHEKICKKLIKKERKPYDSTKHRLEGTGAVPFNKETKDGKKVPIRIPKSNWRNEHETFINTIRAAKEVQDYVAAGGKLADLPPPPPTYNPDYIQCPHCGRRFNEAAAERHIPKCETMIHNKPSKSVPVKKTKPR